MAAIGVEVRAEAGGFEGLCGEVVGAPRRRSSGRLLLFLELRTADGSAAHVLIKGASIGGRVADERALALRRDLRQGDTVAVRACACEWFTPRGAAQPARLWHAEDVTPVTMSVIGNTGRARHVACGAVGGASPPPAARDGVGAAGGASSPAAAAGENDDDLDAAPEVHPAADGARHAERFAVFAAWLAATFPRELADPTRRVLDIAGGKGELALALALGGARVTLVDPRPNAGALSQRQRKQLRRSSARPFEIRRHFFEGGAAAAAAGGARDDGGGLAGDGLPACAASAVLSPGVGGLGAALATADAADDDGDDGDDDDDDDRAQRRGAARTAELLANASLVVGLHPDEATEAIVRCALAAGLPFAVAPCCVFARLFPTRRHAGAAVRTHAQLCDYLQGLATGARRTTLPFAGQNTVIYHLGEYAAAAVAAPDPAGPAAG